MQVRSTDLRNLKPRTKIVIGLTGGIGSGKTVASDWFAQKGIDVIDADVIAHEIVAKNSPTLRNIQNKFGDWTITEQGELNRQALREYVFTHSHALMELESITHPAIRDNAKEQLLQANSPYAILSAPLLLEGNEAGLVNLCHHILVIDVPETLQIERASKRDGQTSEKIQAVMENQLSRKDRLVKADDVVLNDGSLEELYEKLTQLHYKFLSMSSV